MATEAQNFTKWEEDSFVLQFTVTDAEVDFQSSNYLAYWSMATASAGGYEGDPVLVKTTVGDYSEQGDIRWINASALQVTISRTDTDNLTIQDYYHELVIAENDGTDSVVIATGTFTLKQPLFPEASRSYSP